MASLLWIRDLQGDADGVKHTFSSWDACMSKAYCKWPVIIVIIIVSSIVLSVIWCAARCLCCGLECCCGCLRCCNSCCPSPRRRNNNQGYQQAPPTPYLNQYQQPPAPVYASGGNGYRGASVPQTATFDVSSRSGEKHNEDALPAMPSWSTATSRKEAVIDDVELEKMDHHAGYQSKETLLEHQETGRHYGPGTRTGAQDPSQSGDVGSMSANPYRDYQQHQQFSPSPYESQSRGVPSPSPYGNQGREASSSVPYGSQSHGDSPTSPYESQSHGTPAPYAPTDRQQPSHSGPNAPYFDDHQQSPTYDHQQSGYEPSIPPSYHTRAPTENNSPIEPPARSPQYPGQQTYQAYGGISRQPVNGSWREV